MAFSPFLMPPRAQPEAMRNALREILASESYEKDYKTKSNRERLNDEEHNHKI